MASVYCQELIRNSLRLCESYIGQIFFRAQHSNNIYHQEKDIAAKLNQNYYIEDDKNLLEMLI